MKAVYVAPDLAVLGQIVHMSNTKQKMQEHLSEILDGENDDKNIQAIATNPSNLRYAWVKIDKNEDNIDFITSLLLISANNSYATNTRDIALTQDSAFVSLNLLESYKEISEKEGESIDLDISEKINKDRVKSLVNDLFDAPQFIELHSTGNGPQMFMIAANFSIDTWEMLSSLGIVAKRSYAMYSGDGTEKTPGFCLMFGLSMSSLIHIEENAEKMPEHIREDLDSLPRNEENSE